MACALPMHFSALWACVALQWTRIRMPRTTRSPASSDYIAWRSEAALQSSRSMQEKNRHPCFTAGRGRIAAAYLVAALSRRNRIKQTWHASPTGFTVACDAAQNGTAAHACCIAPYIVGVFCPPSFHVSTQCSFSNAKRAFIKENDSNNARPAFGCLPAGLTAECG